MAAAMGSHRAVAVGVSGGLGLALPLAAYVATMPFDGAHEVVAADMLPFAAGAVAGVGLLALSSSLLDVRDRRRAAHEADAAARSFAGADAASTHVRASAPKGVPVINRAVDALDEEAAWAEIDAMFTDGSPFSCDPARSKDMYQIAFEELRRTATARPAASARPVQPDTTAMYAAAAGVSTAQASAPVLRADASAPAAGHAVAPAGASASGDADEQAARDAAMAALYGPSPLTAARPAAPASTPHQVAPQDSAPATAAEPDSSIEVPVADYSGHEAMWEAALAILDEQSAPRVSPAATSFVAADRMAAMAAGGTATTMHDHVNEMIGQELDRASSSSVRGATHEFLRVVQGGTASMPRMTAEA